MRQQRDDRLDYGREICIWTYDETHDCWYPGCGEEPYTFNNRGPKENRFKFCPYCGRKLKEKKTKNELVKTIDNSVLARSKSE